MSLEYMISGRNMLTNKFAESCKIGELRSSMQLTRSYRDNLLSECTTIIHIRREVGFKMLRQEHRYSVLTLVKTVV